jgi:hypothetical protein
MQHGNGGARPPGSPRAQLLLAFALAPALGSRSPRLLLLIALALLLL